MKRLVHQSILGAKDQSDGVFWIIDDKLVAYPFGSVDTFEGVAKSGNTYNHKKLWNDLNPTGSKHPYNYYPRGRVVINSRGKAAIYMNPNVNDSFIKSIRTEFGLRSDPKVIYDNSEHYKCYLDDGWRPDNTK